jgi:hypothetical protein
LPGEAQKMTMPEDQKRIYRICPYLGQRTDPETALSYPSDLNCCTHAKPAAAVEFDHQEEYCLTDKYSRCEEYTSEPDSSLPAGLHSFSRRVSGNGRKGSRVLVLALVILVIVTAGWMITRGGGFGQVLGFPTLTLEFTPTGTEIPTTPTPTDTPTPIFTPTLEKTATIRPILGLETLTGLDHKFLIHQIQEGDSLDRIASRYGTTVDAVMNINYRIPSPLVQGWSVIVPVNFTDTQDLPAFEVYGVTQKGSIEDLATQLSVDLGKLEYYNALGDGFVLEPGDWVLVPRVKLLTPSPTP